MSSTCSSQVVSPDRRYWLIRGKYVWMLKEPLDVSFHNWTEWLSQLSNVMAEFGVTIEEKDSKLEFPAEDEFAFTKYQERQVASYILINLDNHLRDIVEEYMTKNSLVKTDSKAVWRSVVYARYHPTFQVLLDMMLEEMFLSQGFYAHPQARFKDSFFNKFIERIKGLPIDQVLAMVTMAKLKRDQPAVFSRVKEWTRYEPATRYKPGAKPDYTRIPSCSEVKMYLADIESGEKELIYADIEYQARVGPLINPDFKNDPRFRTAYSKAREKETALTMAVVNKARKELRRSAGEALVMDTKRRKVSNPRGKKHKKEVQCYQCKEIGHFKSRCPN